jgi:hypothetical protein
MVLAVAGIAAAVPINYGNFLGSSPGEVDFLQVIEDSMTDATPLFGAPVRVGNLLYFFPTTFAAAADDGSYDATSGTLTISIRAGAGYYLASVGVNEIGDYTLLGDGTFDTWVDVYGLLGVTDVVPGSHGSFADLLDVSPPPPYTLPPPGFGDFAGDAAVDLSIHDISQINFAFSDTLEAVSELGTSAFVQKKVFVVEVTTVPIPEPASVMLTLPCLIALLAHRTRCRSS